jgi:quercetin dioxygenase-like cupin family protein
MIKYHWHFDGDKFGMVYEMPAGELIKTHIHEDDHLHDINVLVGHVVLSHPDGDQVGYAGDRITFDGHQPHSIRALTHSVIRNMFTHGMPRGYGALPLSEHSGQF